MLATGLWSRSRCHWVVIMSDPLYKLFVRWKRFGKVRNLQNETCRWPNPQKPSSRYGLFQKLRPEGAKIGHTAIYLAPDSSHDLSWCHRGINPLRKASEELAVDMWSSCDLLALTSHCFKCWDICDSQSWSKHSGKGNQRITARVHVNSYMLTPCQSNSNSSTIPASRITSYPGNLRSLPEQPQANTASVSGLYCYPK